MPLESIYKAAGPRLRGKLYRGIWQGRKSFKGPILGR